MPLGIAMPGYSPTNCHILRLLRKANIPMCAVPGVENAVFYHDALNCLVRQAYGVKELPEHVEVVMTQQLEIRRQQYYLFRLAIMQEKAAGVLVRRNILEP